MNPITDNLRLIDREAIEAFVDMNFNYVDGEFALMIRGVGESGTAQEGKGGQNISVQIGSNSWNAVKAIVNAAERWGQYHIATFMVPAAMDPIILADNKGTEDRVKLMGAVCVDLDKGDTTALAGHLGKYLGTPTMVVRSGGTTETGAPKRHLWWKLTEPTSDVATVGRIRELIAKMVGGDLSFKRIAQVVRIPGTVYAKGGVAKAATIEFHDRQAEYDYAEFREAVAFMPPAPGIDVPQVAAPLLGEDRVLIGGGLTFASDAGQAMRKIGPELVEQIHAGGEGDATRWSRFNQVWGHYLHCVRAGEMTLAEADRDCRGWVETNMIPPWPPERLNREMEALAKKDVLAHGPFEVASVRGETDSTGLPPVDGQGGDGSPPAPVATGDVKIPAASPSTSLPEAPAWARSQGMTKPAAEPHRFDLVTRWNVGRLTEGPKPKRRFLVDGLIQAGMPMLLAAEGGAGKTGQIIDLALKLAAYGKDWMPPGGDPLMWWGQRITEHADQGSVAIITSEDDAAELHIRLKEMDGLGLLERARDRLFILPLINAGGAFPFIRKARGGGAEPSAKWRQLYDELSKIPRLIFTGIDTLNSTLHGEDVRPDVIQEYFNEANQICGSLGSALAVTHHIRKAGKTPIRTLSDMKEAVRGSSALPAAVRCVIGFWHASDYKRRLTALGLPAVAGSCYLAGVLKANNPEFIRDTKTLVRDAYGSFMDKTRAPETRALTAVGGGLEEAWLVEACARAVRDRHPLKLTDKTMGLFARRAELPPRLRGLTRAVLEGMAGRLVAAGQLVVCKLAGPGGRVLDVPEGIAAHKQGYDDPGKWKVQWTDEYVELGPTQQVFLKTAMEGKKA